jgi:serine phosphatase RsbU (regulator of sigma subunit)
VNHDGDGMQLELLSALLTAMEAPAIATDRHGRILAMNDQADQLVVGAQAGADVPTAVFDEPDCSTAEEALGLVSTGQHWEGVLHVRTPRGRARRTVLWSPIPGPRAQGGTLLRLGAGTPQGWAADDDGTLIQHLARLARVTSELLFVETIDEVTQVVIGHLADEASATVASLSLLVDPETLELLGLRGGRDGAARRWARYAVSADTPASLAVRTGEPVLLRGRREIAERFPSLEAAAEGERTILCLPLRASGASIGVLTMSFPGAEGPDAGLVEFFGVVADACAQAVARLKAAGVAADRATKLSYLAQASAELGSSLDYELTLRRVADMAVPWFADWCAISLEQDGLLRTLAVAHVDPDKVRLALEFQQRWPADPGVDRGSYRVLRTGESELTPEITDEMIEAIITDPEQLAIIRALDFRSAMVVPLRTDHRILGVVTWVAGRDGRRYDEADLAMGEDLARRAATAIDNAQLHSEQRQLAAQLHEAVLPSSLPQVDGAEIVAEYQPSGRTEVGGDFYDAVALGPRRVALVVGDVMGRGVAAAARMAQTRAAVRALVALDPEPAAVFAGLDRVFESQGIEELVTMVYAVVDLDAGTCRVSSAGHPGPLVVPAHGPVYSVETTGVLLGAGGGWRPEVSVTLDPGTAIVLFTDGLFERRGEDVDLGLSRIADAATSLRRGELSEALVTMVDLGRDPTRDDDVAVLVMRTQA